MYHIALARLDRPGPRALSSTSPTFGEELPTFPLSVWVSISCVNIAARSRVNQDLAGLVYDPCARLGFKRFLVPLFQRSSLWAGWVAAQLLEAWREARCCVRLLLIQPAWRVCIAWKQGLTRDFSTSRLRNDFIEATLPTAETVASGCQGHRRSLAPGSIPSVTHYPLTNISACCMIHAAL